MPNSTPPPDWVPNSTSCTTNADCPVNEVCVWIQVGAFSSMDNAQGAERRLEAAGETAVIIEGPGGLHRVRLGPFDRESDAEKALAHIASDTGDGACDGGAQHHLLTPQVGVEHVECGL